MFLTSSVQVRNDEKAATEALTEDDIKAINALSKVIFISIVNYIARAIGLVLTSVKEEKHDIFPTTFNFVMRRGKLRIYTLLNPRDILKVCCTWRLQGMGCGMFCLNGEVVFIH